MTAPLWIYTIMTGLSALLLAFLVVSRFVLSNAQWDEVQRNAKNDDPAWWVYLVTIPLTVWIIAAFGWFWATYLLAFTVVFGFIYSVYIQVTKRDLLNWGYLFWSFAVNVIILFGLWSRY